jgi:vitamin B12 transporter
MTSLRLGIQLLASLPSFLLFAQEDLSTNQSSNSKTKKDLPQKTIVANKTLDDVSTTAASVDIVDRTKIDQQQWRLAPEILNSIPGVSIVGGAYPGALNTLVVRGMTTHQTNVLIDGRPMSMNLAGGLPLEHLSLDHLQQVEVLKGPSANLYGSRSMGGLIQLVTRKGKDLKKPEYSFTTEAGSYGYFHNSMSTLGSDHSWDWSINANRTDSEGQRPNSDYKNNSIFANIGYTFSPSLYFELQGNYFNSELGVIGANTSQDFNDQVNYENWSLSPRITWETNDSWTQTLTFMINRYRQVALNEEGFNSNNRISVEDYFIDYQNDIQWNEQFKTTIGLWNQWTTLDRFNDDLGYTDAQEHLSNHALYISNQWNPIDQLYININGRYDYFSDFSAAATGRIGVSYTLPTQTNLFFSFGNAYTPPSPQNTLTALYGNPLLVTPEKSEGLEFGVGQKSRYLDAQCTFFYNRITDLHQYNNLAFQVDVIGKARTQGIETKITLKPYKKLNVEATYTYLNAEGLEGASSARGRLVRRPSHQIYSALTYQPIDPWVISLSATYLIDREDIAGFSRVNLEDLFTVRLTSQYQINKNIKVFGRIENLLGERSQSIAGFPIQSTGAYAGITLTY